MKQFLISTVPFAGFLLGHLLIWYLQKPKIIDCPTFIGLTPLEALLEGAKHKINIRLAKLITHNTSPNNIILSQYPKEKTPVKEQQTVYICVNIPPPLQYAPTIVSKKLEDIKHLPESPIIKIYAIPNRTAVDNIIFSQTPAPGNPLYNDTIKAYVKKKEEEIYIMPLCIGRPLKEVTELFDLYQIPYTYNHNKPEAIIKDQTPTAGTAVTKTSLKMVYFHC